MVGIFFNCTKKRSQLFLGSKILYDVLNKRVYTALHCKNTSEENFGLTCTLMRL